MQKLTKDDLRFNTNRQHHLMRIILDCFEDFRKREQHYYGLEGMTTAHVTLHAIKDFTTLRAFWPEDLVRHTREVGTVYQLQDDTMTKVQSSVRSCLEQLEKLGYIEKIGNEHERRWRPLASLKGVTL